MTALHRIGSRPAQRIADELVAALDARRQIAPVSEREPGLDLALAYEVAACIRGVREARGERVVGRKIGFTNRTIWPEYGVEAPIWSYVYDSTVRELSSGETLDLSAFLEPRIEPEIIFALSRTPKPGMDEPALLSCIDWVAHGIEIVQSHFPSWRFATADTVAAFGLHGALLIGPRHRIESSNEGEWLEALPRFGIDLLRDGVEADHGSGANVLGGPLSALRHLVDLLARDPNNPPLSRGEVVSTGTLTRALPINPGETWSTRLDGLPLPGVRLAFT